MVDHKLSGIRKLGTIRLQGRSTLNRHSSRLRRGFAFTALAAASALVLAGCSGGSADTDTSGGGGKENDAPYNVLVLGGISAEGVLGNNASTSVLAARASAKVLNEAGGILGREVVVTVADDQADPTTAVTLVREAINSDTPPDAIMNSGPSTVADATLPIISAAGILSFNIGPTATSPDPSQFPLNFDLSPSPADHVTGFVGFIEDEGYEKVAVLHGSSSYGETFGKLAKEGIADAGVDVVGIEEYDVASLDMTPQLEALRAEDPDLLVLDAYGAPLGYVLQGIDKLGWDVPIAGNLSVAATGLVSNEPPAGLLGTDQVKNLLMQVYTSTVYDPDATATNEAVEAMLSLGEIKATLILAYNYDALILINAAAESIGSADDPTALAKAIEDPKISGEADTAILQKYIFSPDHHAPEAAADEFRFIPPSPVRDGQYHTDD